MGSFGDAVTSLVDTYTQCLAFLKDLDRGKQAGEQGSELRRALRKARSKIRRVYSSRLSRQGSSFERGDATSRGSLKRVIRRLAETLSSIGGSKSTQVARGSLDYASLVSLCDSSRSDAIRTMTDLSTRLSVSNSAVSRSSRPRHSSRSRHGGRHSKPGTTREGSSRDPSQAKRLSRTTMSSNSTKLGEVRRPGASHGREPRVAYPRRLQKHDAPVKRMKRWGIF